MVVGPANPLRIERDALATLECNVDAKPKVNGVRWMRNSRFITSEPNHVINRVSIQDAGKFIRQSNESYLLLFPVKSRNEFLKIVIVLQENTLARQRTVWEEWGNRT